MCGLGVLLTLPAFGALASGAAQAATSADELDPVDVVEVSGLVDRIVADNIETAIERSQNNGSQAVILQLNSKGAVIGRERMGTLGIHRGVKGAHCNLGGPKRIACVRITGTNACRCRRHCHGTGCTCWSYRNVVVGE